jgi:CelD/BcsL family acetyltransferase involved in cellulose biosynthesis
VRLVLHREIPDDPTLRRQWNRIVSQMEQPQVFYTWEWAFAMQSAYRASLKPLLFLGYEGDELVGVACLAEDAAEQNVNFLAAATSDYCEFFSHPNCRRQLIDAVLAELHMIGLESLAMASIPEDSPTVAALRDAATGHGYRVFAHSAQICAQVILGSGEPRQQLKATVLNKKMLRRNLRALEREGPITLTHLRSRGEVEASLPHFMRSHVARFLVTKRISNLTFPERRRFFAELARLLSHSGWLFLSRLSVGERVIAWNYGFRFCGSWFWYQPTFESQMEQYSPGFCLLSKLVAEACDASDLNVVDLGVGSEGYKERFSNEARQTLDFSLNRSPRRHQQVIGRYWTAIAIKASPTVESAIRGGLSRLDSARARFREGGPKAFIDWGAKRLRRGISQRDEVLFYEWAGSVPARQNWAGMEIKSLDLETLVDSATVHADDSETMSYLLRATQRLHREGGSGFALVNADLVPVHYCWVSDFEGFYMDELKVQLAAPGKNAVMIFDCWTPRSARGHGYYSLAVSRVAQNLWNAGKVPWIFSAAQNTPSVRGIEKASFQRRYSMIRRKVLFWEGLQTRPSVASSVAVVGS